MGSGSKRRFFERDASPVVASEDDFDAVFGSMTEGPSSTPQDIPIERIRTNPFQARVKFEDIEELAESMRVHGFTSRLRVRRDPAQPQFFQLVYGERRWRAAGLAGIKVLPCDVAEYTDRQMREIGLTENLQRNDLDPLEEAHAFQQAMQQDGYSVRSLAERISKSKGYIQNRLDLLRAPEDVQQMVAARPDTLASALVIAQLPTAEQRQPLIEGLTGRSLNAEGVREIVRGARSAPRRGARTTDDAPFDDASAPLDTRASAARSSASRSEPRVSRPAQQSKRAVHQVTHTLDVLAASIEEALPVLQPRERAALLDYILQTHFPRLEQLVAELQQKDVNR